MNNLFSKVDRIEQRKIEKLMDYKISMPLSVVNENSERESNETQKDRSIQHKIEIMKEKLTNLYLYQQFNTFYEEVFGLNLVKKYHSKLNNVNSIIIFVKYFIIFLVFIPDR